VDEIRCSDQSEPIPHLVEEETPLPRSDGRKGGHTDRKEIA
jgi:hypothetical protein